MAIRVNSLRSILRSEVQEKTIKTIAVKVNDYIWTLMVTKANFIAFSMSLLSRIMHQVTKTILHRNFLYIHILRVIKTTSNAFLMTLLSRIMHQVAKVIIIWNFFKILTRILSTKILLHFQWPRCLGSRTRSLK